MSKSTKVLLKFAPILLTFGLVFLIAALPSLAIESGPEAEQMVMAFSEANPNTETSEALLQDHHSSPPTVTFQIVIKNRSPYGGLDTDFSPGVWALHAGSVTALFTTGIRASPGLEALAEDGNTSMIIPQLMTDTIWQYGEFGPIRPGDWYTFTVATTRTDAYLSWATMFVESNDLFIGPGQNGMPLFENGVPRSGDVTSDVKLWDAGTERNEAPGMGPHQALRQSGPNVGFSERGVYEAEDSTRSLPAAHAIGEIKITESAGEFWITMTNVSEHHPNAISTPLTPIFYTLHAQDWDGLFIDGQPAPDNGLEALAEYGSFTELLAYYTALTNSMGLTQTSAVASPRGALNLGDGPLLPGYYYEFHVTPTADYPCLSMASMVVESNDAFLAFGSNGLCLVDENGDPRKISDIDDDIKKDWRVWDAGTEANETPGAGSWQPERTGAVNAGPVDDNTNVRLYSDSTNDLADFSNFATLEIVDGGWDGTTLTMTVSNVSSGTHYQGSLAHILWAVHMTGTQMFTRGEHASPGLEILAEDGNPDTLTRELSATGGVLTWGTSDTITPGGEAKYTFSVTPTKDYPWLSVASMVVPSNDTFMAFGSRGIRLLNEDGSPRDVMSITTDIAAELIAWDAGTEQNQAGAAGTDQAPRQAAGNTGQMETGFNEGTQYVRQLDDRVWYYPGHPHDPDDINDLIEVSVIVEPDARLRVRKWSDKPVYNQGDLIHYHYEIWNTGAVILSNISAQDGLSINETGAMTEPLILGTTSLGPDERTTATLAISTTVYGWYTNTVRVTGYYTSDGTNQPFPGGITGSVQLVVNDHATHTVYVAQKLEPSITVQKEADPMMVTVGEPITYTIWVTNDNPVTLTNVMWDDSLRGSAMTDTLDPNQSLHWTYAHTPTTPTTELMNVITVWGNSGMGGREERPEGTLYLPGGIVSDTAMATVMVNPLKVSLELTKTASAAYVNQGQVVTYTYMVHNTGEGDFTIESAESVNTQLVDGDVVFSDTVPHLAGMTVPAGEKRMSMVTYTTTSEDYPTLVNTFTVVASNTSGTVTETASVAVGVGDAELNIEEMSTFTFTPLISGSGDIIITVTEGITGRLNLRVSDVFTPTDLRGLTEDNKDSWCFRFDLTRLTRAGANNEILPLYTGQSVTFEFDVSLLQATCVQFVQQTAQAYRSTPDGWVKEGITMQFDDLPTIRVILTHLSDFLLATEERVEVYLPLVQK